MNAKQQSPALGNLLTLALALTFPATLLAQYIVTTGFQSPSGNIMCYSESAENTPLPLSIECLVLENSWQQAPIEDCGLDETSAVVLPKTGSARVENHCHGDVFWPIPLPEISYGTIWSLAGFQCEMETTGVTCTNQDGKGFMANSKALKVF